MKPVTDALTKIEAELRAATPESGGEAVSRDPVISDLNLLSLMLKATRSQVLSDRDRKEAQDAVTRIRDAWEAR